MNYTKSLLCLLTCVLFPLLVHARPDDKANETPKTRFKVKYHRWVAAIYEHPGTRLLSDSRAYTAFPEFAEIVKLGHSALPAIAQEIESGSDMSLFLGEAIFQITGWKHSDFDVKTGGLQELNKQLLKHLRDEKIIPQ